MNKLLIILSSFFIVSCSTTYNDFVQYSMENKNKFPNGYCVYSILETYDGRFPKYLDGRQECSNTLESAKTASLNRCSVANNYKLCMVAFHFDSSRNHITKYENFHIERRSKIIAQKREEVQQERYRRELAAKEKVASKCDGYGFNRNTTEHSNCMLQIDTADKLEQQSRDAQYRQEQLLKKIEQQQALDSLNNSLQNINRSINPPSVTCNPNISGGVTCK
jgi:hypothetical protein